MTNEHHKRGKRSRGTNPDRPSRKPYLTDAQRERQKAIRAEANRYTSTESTSVAVQQTGAYFECLSADEVFNPESGDVELMPIVDKSLTTKLHLRQFSPEVEKAITINGRQLHHKGDQIPDPKTGLLRKIGPADTVKALDVLMVPVSDQRVLKMSDKTLLYRDKPESKIPIFKRLTSKSKRVLVDRDSVLTNRPDRGDTLPTTPRGKVVWRTLAEVNRLIKDADDPSL